MLNRTNLFIVCIAIAGALAGYFAGGWLRAPTAPAADANAALTIGTRAPAIALPDPAGKAHTLDEWNGKLIVLNFWASWCGPCREEMPLLDRSQNQLSNRGVQVVGIAVDAADATRAFLAAHPVRYPILVNDPDSMADASVAYGNSRGVLPFTVLIGRDGRILAQRFGNFSEKSFNQWLQPHL